MKTHRLFISLLSAVVALGSGSATDAAERLQSTVRRVSTVATAASAKSDNTMSISGTVVDTSGKPVAGATVECYQYDLAAAMSGRPDMEVKQSITAGADGSYKIEVPRSTTVLVARKAGLAPGWSQYWDRSKNLTGETIVLTPTTTLAGIVVDETDKPVPDAEVFVSMSCAIRQREEGASSWDYLSGKVAHELFSTRTGADGKFVLQGFPTNAVTDLGVNKAGKVLREPPRQSIGPDTMRWQAGQQDIKLVVETGGNIEGKVVAQDGGQPLAGVKIWAQSSQPGTFAFSRREPVESGPDGAFKVADLPAGSYQLHAMFGTNKPPEWVAEAVSATVESGQTTRDVQISATRGGLLEVSVLDKADRQPVAEVNVSAFARGVSASGVSSSNGIALLRLTPGDYQVNASKDNARSEANSATVENGRTNRLQIELSPPPRIAGTVRDPSGAPVAGVTLSVTPRWGMDSGGAETDANGQYGFTWDARRYGSRDQTFTLIARDVAHNLAAAHDLEEGAAKVDLKLEPGVVVVGRVEDVNGKALSNASVRLFVWSGNSGSQFEDKPTKTDAQGHFEVTALPPGRRYSLDVNLKGYGSANQQIEEPSETNRVELAACVLKLADQKLAGQVLDGEDKPVARASVYMYGQGQPNSSVRTDAKGWFKFDAVCEGTVQLSANAQNAHGSARAEAGDTNVVIHLGENQSYSYRAEPKRSSLKGKPLPDLAQVELAADAAPAGKPILLCLFDIEQRPSRRFIKQLTEQHDALRQKGLTVVGLQATVTTAGAFKEWKEGSTVPFPVGRVAVKQSKTKWAFDVEKLPWLILADGNRRVAAEGFELGEIDAKLKAMPK